MPWTPRRCSRFIGFWVSLALVGCQSGEGAARTPVSPRPTPIRAELAAPRLESVLQALADAPSLELLSLDPGDGRWLPLGSTVLFGPDQTEIVDALKEGVEERGEGTVACFRPRHALVVRTGASGYGLLICFECLRMRISPFDPQEIYDPNNAYANSLEVAISGRPAPVFNAVLKRRSVPLPRR